ncbi:MAG: hypothetical protein ACFCUI_09815 [Bernardetiaceae bacterium]
MYGLPKKFVFYLLLIALMACTPSRKTLTFAPAPDAFANLTGNEFLNALEEQLPPPNFIQQPYRTPAQAEFTYVGHITAQEEIRMHIQKNGYRYQGYYTSNLHPDTIRLAGMPRDTTLWNAKVEIITDQEQPMSFITDALDEYQSFYFELTGTHGKVGRPEAEGNVFHLYRQNFTLPTYRLQKPTTGITPAKILKDLKTATDAATLQKKLSDYNLVLNRSDLQSIEIDDDVYTTFQPNEDFQATLEYRNLFGDPTKEAVIRVSYRNILFFYSFFYKTDKTWQQVPGIVYLDREGFAQTPCMKLEGYPEDAFWLPRWEKLQNKDQEVLTGKAISGYCGTGIDRGSEVYFHIWQITEAGVEQLFSVREFDYWYASPSPAPVGRVIQRKLAFTETYPRALCITDEIQTPQTDANGDFIRLETSKTFVTEVDLAFKK